jgi:hypothetical protein
VERVSGVVAVGDHLAARVSPPPGEGEELPLLVI